MADAAHDRLRARIEGGGFAHNDVEKIVGLLMEVRCSTNRHPLDLLVVAFGPSPPNEALTSPPPRAPPTAAAA